MIYLGTQEIKKVFLGSTPVKKIYKGAQLVWQAITLLQAFINRVNLDGGTYYENGAAANIDKTASLVLTPSAVKAGKLYSILPEDGTGDFAVERNSTATMVNEAGLIEVVPANVARIDYSTGEPMLLVEGQATNLFINSTVNSHDTYLQGITIEPMISPSGDNDAYLLKESASPGTHRFYKMVSLVAGATYTLSAFVKPNGRHLCKLVISGSQRSENFDLNAGTAPIGGTIQKIRDYYRISYTANGLSSSLQLLELVDKPASVNSYEGDGVSGMIVWGVQIETGSKATSYIPTNGSAVTRLGETIKTPSTVDLAHDFTLFFDFERLSGNTLFEIENTAYKRFIWRNNIIYYPNTNGTLSAVSVFTPSGRIGLKIEGNVLKAFQNGVLRTEFDASNLDRSLVSTGILLFKEVNDTNELTGRLKNFKRYSTALTDQQLIVLTTL